MDKYIKTLSAKTVNAIDKITAALRTDEMNAYLKKLTTEYSEIGDSS